MIITLWDSGIILQVIHGPGHVVLEYRYVVIHREKAVIERTIDVLDLIRNCIRRVDVKWSPIRLPRLVLRTTYVL